MKANMLVTLLAAWLLLDDYPRQAGVDVVAYQVVLDVDVEHAELKCRASIEIAVDRALRQLRLDYEGPALEQLSVDQTTAAAELRGAELVIPVSESQAADGRLTVAARYRGRPRSGFYFAETTHQRKVAYTDCWPQRARGWLPCIDHPCDRAQLELCIRAPAALAVAANGAEVATLSLPDQRTEHRFRQQLPIATYLFAVAVGPLEATAHHLESFDQRQLPVITLTYPEEHDAAITGFAPTARVLDTLEGMLGRYPFAKLEIVQIPTRFGGMENASCIFLNERCLASHEPLLPLIAHEVAHQWFGDLIGLADWGELWLSEGFATYCTVLVQEKQDGHDALVREMRRHLSALLADDEMRRRSIRDRHVQDPEVELNSLNYGKGAFVLHMLRHRLGEDAFFRTLREHVATNAGRVITTEDFRRVAEHVSGKDLQAFFAQWIDRAGYPELRVAKHLAARDQKLVLVIDVEQTQPGEPFDLDLGVTIDATAHRAVALVDGQRHGTFELPIDRPPKSVTFNDDAWLLASIEE
ncbi:MAG: M1 family metallopeptidase [Planctomycetota bacterium]